MYLLDKFVEKTLKEMFNNNISTNDGIRMKKQACSFQFHRNALSFERSTKNCAKYDVRKSNLKFIRLVS